MAMQTLVFSQLSSKPHKNKDPFKYTQRQRSHALINHITKDALGLLSTKGSLYLAVINSYLMLKVKRLDHPSLKIDFNN